MPLGNGDVARCPQIEVRFERASDAKLPKAGSDLQSKDGAHPCGRLDIATEGAPDPVADQL